MKLTKRSTTHRKIAAMSLLCLILVRAAGFAQQPYGSDSQTNVSASEIPAQTQAVSGTNTAASSQQTQTELIQKLLGRIDQIEARQAEQLQALQKAREEEVQALLGRINTLQSNVVALEAGRVVPLVAAAPTEAAAVQELDQKIRVLERKQELDKEASVEKAKSTPVASIGANGFSIRSADSNFVVALNGLLQVDSRTFFADGGINGNSGFLLRRARPILSGTVYRDFDFMFVPDFGTGNNGGNNGNTPTPSIVDAYINYRYDPGLQFRFGKFKPPIGLEQLQADVALLFNERSLVSQLVPSRDVGAQVFGDLFDGGLSYAAGIFNGVGDYRVSSNSSFEDDKDFAGRLFFLPFKKSNTRALQGLGFGVGGSYGSSSSAAGLPSTTGSTGNAIPGYVTDGQQQFFAYRATVVAGGQHWRLSPQAYYFYGPLGLMAEYAISDQEVKIATTTTSDALQNSAWEVSGTWVLTGEDASYRGVNPKHPFNLSEGYWGALSLVARFAQLNIDGDAFPIYSDPTVSANKASCWAVGLTWWLNRNVKVNADFAHTSFEGGGGGAGLTAPSNVTHQPENVLFTRLQLAF